jgi:protocatechuate 3,4-dioxygenase beta subunit
VRPRAGRSDRAARRARPYLTPTFAWSHRGHEAHAQPAGGHRRARHREPRDRPRRLWGGARRRPQRGDTEQGAEATVEPKSSTSRATAERFDDAATCTVTPELTEGPFYFDVDSIRSDIREDREGTLLRLALRVRDAGSCEPIENAVVDIWHCDAEGSYSGFESGGPGGGGGGPTDETTYLRGAQVTNAEGIVEFKTIYPGWYRGRTIHIHAKVHLDRRTVLTTQLFFDEAVTRDVLEAAAYTRDDGGRDTFNDSDGIFAEPLVMTTTKEDTGYLGVLTFDVERS